MIRAIAAVGVLAGLVVGCGSDEPEPPESFFDRCVSHVRFTCDRAQDCAMDLGNPMAGIGGRNAAAPTGPRHEFPVDDVESCYNSMWVICYPPTLAACEFETATFDCDGRTLPITVDTCLE